ncbi:cysteine hydrolase family protein [Amycolatopsis alkalitolerans]|uniref:Cysteine hydrolase n=1 Tax=Amycolatopsis alkalitolerans TaxID=2547244 RepID=A0A5C4LW39_9PSEU|nr:isochorismatase family cysteine hydrolase [Amycolatopsis alkalitolerans]TNC23402.1 cysteine hydrolase [Amycolatopsis alkalitolerans]
MAVPRSPTRLSRGGDRGVGGLLAGSWHGELTAGLGSRPGDLVVDKCRFDAFQRTSLEPLVRGLGATELVVCGVATNFCVESTVRSAIMRDFAVTLLEDACASTTPRLHEPVSAALPAGSPRA